MPNRIIKESINESRSLSEVSFFADDLYKRLITYADDYGRFNADYQILRARLYPREIEIVSDADIEDAMTELVGVGKIAFYTSKSRNELYGCFPKWSEHQRLRESKAKIPEPDSREVNDWYLRRFIPLSLKVKVLERDNFKCQECGKYISANTESAKKLIKMGTGLFHYDHIVPVVQGGRATEENLRILCPKCNLSRRKNYSIEEILEITRQVAASCGNLRPESESESNPNQNPESNAHAHARDESSRNESDFARVYDFYRNRVNPTPSQLSMDMLRDYTAKLNADVVIHALQVALDERKTAWSYIRAILGRYERDGLHDLEAVLQAERHHNAGKAQQEPQTKPQEQRIRPFTPPEERQPAYDLSKYVEWPPGSNNYVHEDELERLKANGKA